MRTRSLDTDPEAERVQLDLLRRASRARRAQMALALSADVIRLARRAVRRAHPEMDERDADLAYVASTYGPDLAEGLRADLMRRARGAQPKR